MDIKDEFFEIENSLEKKRKNIKTFDDLISFLKEVNEGGNTGYNTSPNEIAQAALATAWFFASEFGITGFQAQYVMWDFIRDWFYFDNKCGMRIMDYDKMLYPQYDYRFKNIISKDTFESLQERAKEHLQVDKDAAPAVIQHWQSIVDGKVPFGYTVDEEDPF